MAHIIGTSREQMLLLPESLDDYVGPGNPVRFIEAFVNELDLGMQVSLGRHPSQQAGPAMTRPICLNFTSTVI